MNLNNPNHIFIIAEAGSNWKAGTFDEDLSRAKKLIQTAAKSGADAIKFQTYKVETVYVENAGQSKYLTESGVNESINDIFKKFSMPYSMLKPLYDECLKNNIIFMSTPFSVSDAKEINQYVSVHKIASYELNHIRLLEFLAKTNKPIILSTGASNNEEIDFAIDLLRKNGANSIFLMQSTSKYPAPLDSLNLSVIPKMKRNYNLPVGFSDHSLDPIIGPLLSIGFGATFIEKHFTLDKNLQGPDHSFALNPEELTVMVSAIRKSEKAIGNSVKEVLKAEEELRNFAVRSIQATKDISIGEIFQENVNIDILRSGNQNRGADPRLLMKIIGKTSKRDIKIGDGVKIEDCSN